VFVILCVSEKPWGWRLGAETCSSF